MQCLPPPTGGDEAMGDGGSVQKIMTLVVEKILAEFFIADAIGRFVEMAGQFGDGVEVGLPSPFGEVVELHVFGHAFAKFSHDDPPFVKD